MYVADQGRSITWRGQRRERLRTATNRCSRRKELLREGQRLPPCTSPRTCKKRGGNDSRHPVVLPQECLDGRPRGLDSIREVPSDRIDEVDAVIDSAVRVTQQIVIAVRTPAVTDDGNPAVNQCVRRSIRYGNKKCSARLSFNTTKHPLTLNKVPSMIISPSEHALVNFDGLVRTTDLF